MRQNQNIKMNVLKLEPKKSQRDQIESLKRWKERGREREIEREKKIQIVQ